MSLPVITRFAPSPTGSLHLGNARTAFFSHLWARKSGGRFILRIEDTDYRAQPDCVSAIELMVDLGWLGLDWDEGPDVGGPSGPYSQSERGAFYRELFARLQAGGQAYPCYCTAEDLELSRKLQRMAGKPPRYAGTCRNLSSAERADREARGLAADAAVCGAGRHRGRVRRPGPRTAEIRCERHRRFHHSPRGRHGGLLLLQCRRRCSHGRDSCAARRRSSHQYPASADAARCAAAAAPGLWACGIAGGSGRGPIVQAPWQHQRA